MRFRYLKTGDLEKATDTSDLIEQLEVSLKQIDFDQASGDRKFLQHLLVQSEKWLDSGDTAFRSVERRADGMIFREKADIAIESLLQKMFLQ